MPVETILVIVLLFGAIPAAALFSIFYRRK